MPPEDTGLAQEMDGTRLDGPVGVPDQPRRQYLIDGRVYAWYAGTPSNSSTVTNR